MHIRLCKILSSTVPSLPHHVEFEWSFASSYSGMMRNLPCKWGIPVCPWKHVHVMFVFMYLHTKTKASLFLHQPITRLSIVLHASPCSTILDTPYMILRPAELWMSLSLLVYQWWSGSFLNPTQYNSLGALFISQHNHFLLWFCFFYLWNFHFRAPLSTNAVYRMHLKISCFCFGFSFFSLNYT